MLIRKIKKPLWIFISITCFCMALFYVALNSMRLKKIGCRENNFQLSQTDKDIVKSECTGISDVAKLIDKCNKLTCRQLKFAYRNDLNHGKANCVGYAKFHAALLNYAFLINDMHYKVRPVYGKAYLWGEDLHPIFKSFVPQKYEPFFNDHDFTEIDLGDEYIYVDTSIQDLLSFNYFVKQQK